MCVCVCVCVFIYYIYLPYTIYILFTIYYIYFIYHILYILPYTILYILYIFTIYLEMFSKLILLGRIWNGGLEHDFVCPSPQRINVCTHDGRRLRQVRISTPSGDSHDPQVPVRVTQKLRLGEESASSHDSSALEGGKWEAVTNQVNWRRKPCLAF